MAIKLYRENRVRLTFEGVASRSDEQADKVDLGVLLLWNHDLVRDARDGRLVVDGWFEFRIQRQHLLDHGVTLLFQLAPGAELARVQPLAVCAVDGLGRRRSDSATQEKKRTFVHCSSTKFQRRRDHRKKTFSRWSGRYTDAHTTAVAQREEQQTGYSISGGRPY